MAVPPDNNNNRTTGNGQEQQPPPPDMRRPENLPTSNFPKDYNPEESAWWFSKLFFLWMRPLFRTAQILHRQHDQALQNDDLLPLPKIDASDRIRRSFETSWQKQQQEKRKAKRTTTSDTEEGDQQQEDDKKRNTDNDTDRIRKACLAVMGTRFWMAGVIKIVNTCLQFSFPLLVNAILKFIEETQSGKFSTDDEWYDRYRGYWLSALLLLVMASKAITENAYFFRVMRSGYQVRVALSVAVYNKSLRLTNAERQSTTLGELVNLMQVDATKVEMFIPQVHVLWDGMLQIVGYMAILYTLIGWPCFVGLIVMVLAGPIQGVIMGKLFGLNRNMVKYTDARVKTTNEALQGMQSVKMFAWEDNFAKMISVHRNQELDFLRQISYLRGFSRAYISALPGLVAVVSFVVYATVADNEISASLLFAALVAFDQLRFPLLFYPMALAQFSQASVSAARLQNFLGMKEISGRDLTSEEKAENAGTFIRKESATQGGGGEIRVENAVVYWSDPNVPLAEDSQHSTSSKSLLKGDKEDAADDATSDSKSVLTDIDTEGNGGVDIKYPKPVLKGVSMTAHPGELCAVVGRVGSGKSTLCSAILNETVLETGEITLQGRVSYASQQPWILNATLRDNILFGLPLDEDRYEKVLEVCQLKHDLDMLEAGDQTEIGEKGINLSGGQKQRVSVARAAYANADTIILDDPLSALDPEVGKRLFQECICEFMAGKTRLLVTNQLQYLKSCDTVVALRHGRVIEQGRFADLVANENGEVSRLLQKNTAGSKKSSSNKKVVAESFDLDKAESKKSEEKNDGALVSKEERATGAVSLSVYLKYIRSGGGLLRFAWVYIGFILASGNILALSSWISYWTSDAPAYERHSEGFYLGLYAALSVSLGILSFIRSFQVVRFGVKASGTLHANLVNAILRAPQSFFDTTPIGRILSRFSKDLYSIDVELADQVDFFLLMTLQAVLSLATILFVTPWFGIAILPLAFIYFRVLNYFREVFRETKRLESISRSPVYAQFSETLGGLPTIRAYGESTRFINSFEEIVDVNTKAYYNNKASDRWLSVRLELIGSSVAGFAAVFAANVAISGSVSGKESNSDFASLAGLSLTLAISITGLLNWCVRTFANLEASMNACERVLYYTEEIQREAGWTTEELETISSELKGQPSGPSSTAVALEAANGKALTVGKQWPEHGKIVMRNLRMRYRIDTPLVLKGLNVEIEAGKRVGVVGRTGSGKSSLLLTLLRLVEPEVDQDPTSYMPPIEIDGVDILRIGLQDLRSRICIIPQNPVLFSGTVRTNMDPFGQYVDDEIWSALDKCGLKLSVEEMAGGLDARISEYGENLSAGMRQMLVLGRALLRRCTILFLDEATSNVDLESDRAIQKTIREAFVGCTVLTIAHRINTIMDSDKILVMKDGLAGEYASPDELLADDSSMFADIVRNSQSEHE